MEVRIIKEGKEPFQGVGYLDDGTMIVVEDARNKIGKDLVISVTSSLQTSAGKMIFGKFDERATLRAADAILTASRSVKESILRRYKFLTYNDVRIIPQGFDPDDITWEESPGWWTEVFLGRRLLFLSAPARGQPRDV